MDLSKDMELIRERYGDPHEVESEFGLLWNYYINNQSDELALSVSFDEGRLSTIIAFENRVMSLRMPIPDEAEREAAAQADDLIVQAGTLAGQGNQAAAMQALEQAVHAAPQYAEAYYWLGLELIKRRDYEHAAAVLETGLKHDPRNLAICYHLALASFNRGNKAWARELCIYLLSASPDSSWHQKAIEILQYADQALREQETEAGGETSAAGPYTPTPQELVAAVFQIDSPEAMKAFVQSFSDQLDTKFQEALEAIVGDILARENSNYKTVQGIGWLINTLGIALRRAGYGEAAEKSFKLLLQIGKQNNDPHLQVDAFGNLGNLYRNRGNLQEARQAMDRAEHLARQLNNQEAALSLQVNSALVYWLENETAEAGRRLADAFEGAQKEELWPIALRAANNLSKLWIEMEDLEKAEFYANEAMSLPGIRGYPEDHQQTIRYLAYIFLLRGDARRGMEFIQSITSEDSRADTVLEIAHMAYTREQYELTLELLETALQVNSLVTPEILLLTGAAHLQLGQIEQAEKYGRKAQSRVDPADARQRMHILYQLCQIRLNNNYRLFQRDFETITHTQEDLQLVARWADANNDRRLLGITLQALGYFWLYLALTLKKGELLLGETVDWEEYCTDSIQATQGAWEIASQDRDIEGMIIYENQIALNYIELEEWDKAELHLSHAHELAMNLPLYHRDHIAGNLFYNLARVYRAKDNVELALKYYLEGIRSAETLRAQAQMESFRISVWFDKQQLYEDTITYCFQVGRLPEALYYLESIKGRVFLEMVSGQTRIAEPSETGWGSLELERRIKHLEEMINEYKDDVQSTGLVQRLEYDRNQTYEKLQAIQFATDWRKPAARISGIVNPLAYQDLRQLLSVD